LPKPPALPWSSPLPPPLPPKPDPPILGPAGVVKLSIFALIAGRTFLILFSSSKAPGPSNPTTLGFSNNFSSQVNLSTNQIIHKNKMHSCGMFIFNASFGLEEKLNFYLPKILNALKIANNCNITLNKF
jgi:hypothetical protein